MRPPIDSVPLSRHHALLVAAATAASVAGPRAAVAGPPLSLKARLDAQDTRLLTKPQGMAAPAEAVYPSWLDGEWRASVSFAGYELPAKDLISRNELFAEGKVPGFQKLSVALLPDIGKSLGESGPATFPMRWVKDSNGLVREDREANFRSAVRGGLGYDAIERVDYKTDPNNPFGLGSNTGNPNRLKLVFAPGLTPNAERIELFINARETEQPEGRDDLFYMSESVRQVTFSAGQSRQINGEYAHFFSFRRLSDTRVQGVIITAAYADPLQLERFFVKVGPNRPLIVFSHGLTLTRDEAAPAS